MKLLHILCFLFLMVSTISCWDKKDPDPIPVPVEKVISPDVAIKWSKATMNFVKHQPANTPTYSSRGYGYMSLVMYESVVAGSIKYKSIAPSLDGLGTLPKPTTTIDWETALNEGQRTLITKIWQNSFITFVGELDTLHKSILKERKLAVNDTMIIFNSRNYGKSIANTIYEWSKTDGGDLGYFKNFDANYKVPTGNGFWLAPVNGQSSSPFPLQPYWGKNRTFVKLNSEIPIPEKMMYSADKSSMYFADFQEIFDITKALTTEQKEIAIWWSDDPTETPAPAGHSMNLATQLIELKRNNLFEATAALAKVGMSVADAFVCCWKVKYNYHSERPANYIRKNIQGNFIQFWPEPPFPAFPSGHSTQVGAASVAMISVFGDNVSFTDNTHKGRQRDEFRNLDYKPRTFSSITQCAEECGFSRLYGGIHTRQDNVVGFDLGKKIGDNVAKLPWKY
jgi:PAP2 superfamily